VKEIVNALLAGDWTRYADDSGHHFYYVIRERDRGIEVNKLQAFDRMLCFGKYEPDAFEDWYIRAALAEEPADRLAKARKRVAAAGIDPSFFDAVIEACKSTKSQGELHRVLEEWMHATSLKDLFRFRNEVAQDAREPQREEAARVLDTIRGTFEALAQHLNEVA
jgi:hypothetical protein